MFGRRERKPFRPVWDTPPPEIEPPPPPPAAPRPTPPLPLHLFEKPAQRLDVTSLPTFDHLVPPDTAALAAAIEDAQDQCDAIAALKAAGFI